MIQIRISLIVLLSVFALNSNAQREDILLNNNWQFRFSYQVKQGTERRVDLPHTWNATDALSGKIDYYRGIGNYKKSVFIEPLWKGKRLFLRFEGANCVTDVFVNGKYIGEHRGGYGAFIFELTDHVNYGAENTILVRVNNAQQFDVMPLVGDFNFYGGIYRDVHLLITDSVCISPLDYASPGVYLVQKAVDHEKANVLARVKLSGVEGTSGQRELRIKILNGQETVYENSKIVHPGADSEESFSIEIPQPHLWNGQEDPFMYRVEVALLNDGKVTDQVVQPLGLRYFHVDPDKGFLLNGKHLALHGVCRHQDRPEIGNALRPIHHEEDVAIMREMGVNATRLAHYPQAEMMYDLMDKYGFITWAEIPFVGPGGYGDKGFVDSEAFRKNGKQQLKELIRQNFNHPSICFWALFNELKTTGDNPIEYIKELNDLAHQEDPGRYTTAASNQSGEINSITDLIAWNRYDGWYGASPKKMETWLENTHKASPNLKIAISEYGAGASIYQQQDSLSQANPGSWWHPENWQTYYHMANWKIIHKHPFLWGSFIWNMFDFGAAHRTEGDRPGINDKGLVTFDRKTKKDAFFFYKANWNKKEPMIHLVGRRAVHRSHATDSIMAFTNEQNAELFVNGESMGTRTPDSYATIVWKDIPLKSGENTIKVVTGTNNLSDEMVWVLEQP